MVIQYEYCTISVKILIIILHAYTPKCYKTLPKNATNFVELSKCKKRRSTVIVKTNNTFQDRQYMLWYKYLMVQGLQPCSPIYPTPENFERSSFQIMNPLADGRQ
ncbi:hypothetical protein BDA99DRAFT_531806 [Phascolomyces articulosus]|uniref:Uncharacterized protein n=1 Tax=Phascolomyces articulosus TaxID=60185 RepID=A0AAD5PIZ9_9FUNG|nr:hypothetical protein BDA99DRAFT_531806 [Phascolomyces articulosus]